MAQTNLVKKYCSISNASKLIVLSASYELMHKTLMTFRKNWQAILNGAALTYSNSCLEGFNRKIKQIERTAYGYSNYINLLTRIGIS